MAQNIQDIINELNAGYDPQRQLINQQISQIQPAEDAAVNGLKAQQNDAFNTITNNARDRGMGFSGIPIQEQSQYTASTFLPAVAKVKQSSLDTKNSLLGSLNALTQDEYNKAYTVRQGQLDTEEKQREAELAAKQAATASSGLSGLFDGIGGGSAPAAGGGARAVQRADGGFNYVDANGNPISAAGYAAAKGLNFRDVLQAAASAGDKGSAAALGFVGNDFGYDPRKITSQQMANLYNSLVWGTGKQARYNSSIPIGSARGMTINVPGSNTPKNGAGSGHPNIYVR